MAEDAAKAVVAGIAAVAAGDGDSAGKFADSTAEAV
jgi:hypothetical protein